MPHSGSFGLVLSLHVLGAIFLVGPLTLITAVAPLLVRSGRAAVGVLRLSVRAVRWLSGATLLIVATGLVLLHQGAFGSVRSPTDTWLLDSLVLWAIATAVSLGVVAPGLTSAVHALEAGRDTRRPTRMILGGAGAASFCWVLITVLMVVKPGA